MIERAIKERWAITPEQRAKVVGRALDLLDDPDQRTQLGAIRALLAADQITLAWFDHELRKKQVEGDGAIDLVAIARGMAAKLGRGELGMGPTGAPPLPE